MEQLPDNTTETATPKPAANWSIALSCGLVVLLVASGGLLIVRDQLFAAMKASSIADAAARDKITARLDRLQSSVDTASSHANPNGDAMAVLESKLAEIATKLDGVSARVDAGEKKAAAAPEPVAQMQFVTPDAPAPAPAAAPASNDMAMLTLTVLSGKPFAGELAAWAKMHPEAQQQVATLGTIAESGLESEADLNRKLRALLDDVTASKKIDDTSFAGKINTHLAGLVSIRKVKQVDAYQQLRKDVLSEDLVSLIHTVEQLDEAARQPFAGWLKEAHLRLDALFALTTLEAKGA